MNFKVNYFFKDVIDKLTSIFTQRIPMKKVMLTCLILLVSSLSAHDVYVKEVNEPLTTLYPKVMKALANSKLIVVSEIDILEKFKHAGLSKKFGKNFNTNKLEGIKAIIACNGYFGNEVANADPEMMALCPVRITLIQQNGKSKILFARPSALSSGSKANAIIMKLEHKVIASLESSLN